MWLGVRDLMVEPEWVPTGGLGTSREQGPWKRVEGSWDWTGGHERVQRGLRLGSKRVYGR